MRTAARITISGYYGCGNTGDEAVLAGILSAFQERAGIGSSSFTVLSQDPAATMRQHGTNAVPRMGRSGVRRAIQHSDLFISGGGSLLQDTTSLRSLFYYLWIIRTARSVGRPVMIYGQGMGPLRRPISRMLTRSVLNRVHHITVRDPGSAELLKRIGVVTPPIEITADPAFALSPASDERATELLSAAGAPAGKELIGMALRQWSSAGNSQHRDLELAKAILSAENRHMLFLPMQPPGDAAISEEVARELGDR